MKLQMNDSAKTVVTYVDSNTEVYYYGMFDELKGCYYFILSINGLNISYYGEGYQKRCKKDFNKLISKGAKAAYRPYIDEQEKAHWDGIAADRANPKLHGHVVMTILAGENSGKLVWDFYAKKTVKPEELTVLTEHEKMLAEKYRGNKEIGYQQPDGCYCTMRKLCSREFCKDCYYHLDK